MLLLNLAPGLGLYHPVPGCPIESFLDHMAISSDWKHVAGLVGEALERTLKRHRFVPEEMGIYSRDPFRKQVRVEIRESVEKDLHEFLLYYSSHLCPLGYTLVLVEDALLAKLPSSLIQVANCIEKIEGCFSDNVLKALTLSGKRGRIRLTAWRCWLSD